jgi:hypothetical protein
MTKQIEMAERKAKPQIPRLRSGMTKQWPVVSDQLSVKADLSAALGMTDQLSG